MLERHALPTRFDLAEYRTVCKVIDNPPQYFIQTSKDPEHAKWVSAQELIIKIFEPLADNENVINKFLTVAEDHEFAGIILKQLLESILD